MKKRKNRYDLLVILITYTLFRLPSLFEPVWYADEGDLYRDRSGIT